MIEEIKVNQLYFFIKVDESQYTQQYQDNFVLTIPLSDQDTMFEEIGLLPLRKAIQSPETVFYRSFNPKKINRSDLYDLVRDKHIELVKTFEGTTFTLGSGNRLLAHIIFRALIGKKKLHTGTLKSLQSETVVRDGKRHYYYGIGKYMRTSCGMKIPDDEFRYKWEYVPNTSNQIRLRNSSGELCKKCQLDDD